MMRKLLVALLVGLGLVAHAQPYGNEWIHYDQQYWYFKVWQDGFRRIDSTTLANAGFPVGTVDPHTIQLYARNKQVPIHVEGEQDGVFNSGDYIEFYGRKNDAWMDSTLWDDPAHINNPYYSLYNDTIRYYLTWGSQAGALRTIDSGSSNWAAYAPLPWVWRTTLLTYPVAYQTGSRTQVGASLCTIGEGEGYFHDQIIASVGADGTSTYSIATPDLYTGPQAPPSTYRLVVAGLNNPGGISCNDHHLRLQHGGTTYADTVFRGYKLIKFELSLPASSVSSPTVVYAISVHDQVCASLPPDYPDVMSPAWQSLRYPGTFLFGNSANIEVPASADSSLMTFPAEPGTVVYAWAPDGLHRTVAVYSTGNSYNAVLPPNAQGMAVSLARPAGILPMGPLKPVNGTGTFHDPAQGLTDSALVIVTHPLLMAAAQQYANYRQTSLANPCNTVLANVEELYDQFGGGIRKHPLAIRNYLRFVYNNAPSRPKGLFLVGKGVRAVTTGSYVYQLGSRVDTVAAAANLVPPIGWPNSDLLYGLNLNGDQPNVLSVPVGRLAARNSTQVLDYLAKVDSVEHQPPAAWMKNILHFRGGNTASEWSQFDAALNSYQAIAEDTSFFGRVTKFVKNGTGVIEQASADSVANLIGQGVTLMTFFAHAYGGGFDITTDVPTNYQWHGKFPTVIGNSCYTGDLNLYDNSSTSESFVLAHNAGAVAFLASSDLGLAGALQLYTTYFYRSFSQLNYGKSIGEHQRYAVENELALGGTEHVNNAETMLLHGDPMLVMNSPKLPDLDIALADVLTIPAQVTADVDSFQVRVVFRNIGRGTHQPFTIALERSIPATGFSFPPLFQQVAMNAFQDTAYFTLPTTVGQNGTGLNNLQVRLDLDPDQIAELDDFGNNTATMQVNITVGDLLPVDPYEFAVVPNSTTMLSASTGDPFAQVRTYLFQIDTTDLFNSPVMEQHSVSAPGGVVQWQPNSIYALNSGQDSVVYFWRCTLDSAGQGVFNWHESSFQHISGKQGWGQAHYFQFKNDGFNLIDYNRPARRFDFQDDMHQIGCEVWGENYNQVYWTKDLELQDGQGCSNKEALVVGVVDPFDFSTWMSRYNGAGRYYGNVNDNGSCRNRQEKYFIFRENYHAQMDSLGSMLSNHIPDGHYVVVYTFLRLLRDSVAASTAMAALHSLGATNLFNGTVPDSVPYIFFCKKGDLSSVQEVWGDSATAHINMTAQFQLNARSGSIRSPRSATALAWQDMSWRSAQQAPYDSVRMVLTGITPQGTEQPLLDLPGYSGNVDIQAVAPASQFPQLRVQGRFWNDTVVIPQPSQLKRWHLLGVPAPECALDPPAGYYLHMDSVFQGQNAAVMVSVHNIGQVPMDSLLMTAWVTDHNNVAHRVHYKYNAPLPVGGILRDTIRFNTQQFPGPNSILIEANPVDTLTQAYDQPEQFHFNNIAQLRFLTLQDLENPILDVTFDGIHILDGDIVSAQPEIQVTLDDENQTLLLNEPSDTAFFKVFLTDPSGTMKRIYFRENGVEVLQFVPASGPSNVSKVFYRPDLVQDGKYRLTVRATDKSRNNSGDRDNSVNFEVINRPTITEVLNYPNPFTTSTRFVFTLTGREIPTAMRIQIMTISGRVVREVPMSELGPLHVGRNITDFAWNGTDQFGDRLARGIYLYRVMAQLHGQDIEYRDGGAGSYFTKGIGKMYLLR